MIHFPLFMALRYLKGIRQEKTITTMAKICFLGIVMGTFCLTLVSVIMRGIEQETYKTLQGCHAPLVMHAHGNHLAFSAIAKLLDKEFPLLSYSPSDFHYLMVKNNKNQLNTLVMLKAIDPIKESSITSLEQKIIHSHATSCTFSATLEHNRVLIGQALASLLKVSCGNTLTVYFAPDPDANSSSLLLDTTTFTIGGIFKTGIEELDANLIICSLDSFTNLFPNAGITSINLKFPTTYEEAALKKALSTRFNLTVNSWQDRYPALFAALKLETYACLIVLLLIIMIASMSITSLLFMYITQKRGNIVLLQLMGASSKSIRSLFIWWGILVAGSALLIGLGLAFIVALLLNSYVIVQLPDAYFVSHLPVALDWRIFGASFLSVAIISFLALLIPTRSISYHSIVQVLRSTT